MATKAKKKATKKTRKPTTPYRSQYVDHAYEQVEQLAKLLYPKEKDSQIFSRVQCALSALTCSPTPIYVTITPCKKKDAKHWGYYWQTLYPESVEGPFKTTDKARADAKKVFDKLRKELGVPRLVLFDDQKDLTD